jgi:SAM-dependent methyltransferase
MTDRFQNVYEDPDRAGAYAELEFPGTYYLAYRDLPEIIGEYAHGRRALDFGCGTGRSSRFLKQLGFTVTGVDISEAMLVQARRRDPGGDYRLVSGTNLDGLGTEPFDLVLSALTFDNIATTETKAELFGSLKRLLAKRGCIVNLVSSPDIYVHEWASFSTRDFPENREAKSGDRVRIVMLDVKDRRPVEDILWSDEDYRDVYSLAGLSLVATYRPLASREEPYVWVSETSTAPWVIYVLHNATCS